MDVDSTTIVDGKFKFEGVAPEALAHGLTTIKGSNRPLVFFLENEKMQDALNKYKQEK